MINLNTEYKLTKISHNNNSLPQTIDVDYWVVGSFIQTPVVGGIAFLWKTMSSRSSNIGYFRTSPIKEIHQEGDSITINTANSVYKVEKYVKEDGS